MNEKIIAVYTISNFFALGIISINLGITDTVTSIFINGDKYENRNTTKIYFDKKGDYIKRYGVKYYLDEFIRTDF